MKIDFIKNISLLLFINVLIRPIYIFGVDLKIQNILGPEEYGVFFILFDFTYLFLFINDPGLQTYSVKTIAENRENPTRIIGQFLSAKILLSILYITVCLIFASLLGYDLRRLWLTFLVSFGFSLAGIFVLLRSVFSGMGEYKTDSYLSGVDKALMIVILGSLAWGITGKIESVEQMVILQNMCYLVAIIITLWLLYKKLPGIRFQIGLKDLTVLLRKTLPYTGLILLTALCNRIDVVMLDLLRTDGEFQSGIYAAGYRFLDAGNMFGYLFGALLLPMYANAYHNKADISELFNTAFKFLLSAGLFITSVLVIYGKEIFSLLYNEVYLNHHQILSALILSLAPIMISHSTGSLLIATGKIRALNLTFAGAILLNITLNWIIIPEYGALGSAYTTLLTEIVLLSVSLYLSYHFCRINFDQKFVFKSIFLVSIPIIWYYFIRRQHDLPWIFDAILFSLVFLLSIILLKIIEWREVIKHLKSKDIS